MVLMEVIKKTFGQYLKEKELAEQTKEVYLRHAGNLERLLAGGPIDQDKIDEYIRQHGNLQARCFIKNYLVWADRKDITIVRPTGRAKTAHKEPAAMDKADVDRMLDYCSQQKLILDGLLIRVGFQCGLRASEYRTITPANISGGDVCTVKFKGKGGDEATMPIRQETYDMLLDYIAANHIAQDQQVFPLTRFQLWRRMKKIGSAALNEKVWPHRLRHSFAMHLRKKGVDMFVLQRLMRHRDISSTQVYSGVQDKEIVEKWKQAME